MRFDRRFLWVMGVSLAWALVVAGAFYRLAGGAAGHSRTVALKQVVVAVRPLPAGSTVERSAVALRGVPESLFPAGAFTRVEEVLERPVTSPIQAGEPLIEARLAARGSGFGLGPLIPPGMRAIAVRVNDVVGVAGFTLPGTRVDVLVTGRPGDHLDTETQIVLQDILVLSAGQTTETDGKSSPVVAPVVTLLVSPPQAESLTLAGSEGRLQLVLRNSTDRALVTTSGRRLREIYAADAPPAPALVAAAVPRSVRRAARPVPAAAPPVAAAEPESMLVIQGKVKRVVVFGEGQDTP